MCGALAVGSLKYLSNPSEPAAAFPLNNTKANCGDFNFAADATWTGNRANFVGHLNGAANRLETYDDLSNSPLVDIQDVVFPWWPGAVVATWEEFTGNSADSLAFGDCTDGVIKFNTLKEATILQSIDFFQYLTAHEMAHVLGLGHGHRTDSGRPLMYPGSTGSRVLAKDDRQQLNWELAGGAIPSVTSNGGAENGTTDWETTTNQNSMSLNAVNGFAQTGDWSFRLNSSSVFNYASQTAILTDMHSRSGIGDNEVLNVDARARVRRSSNFSGEAGLQLLTRDRNFNPGTSGPFAYLFEITKDGDGPILGGGNAYTLVGSWKGTPTTSGSDWTEVVFPDPAVEYDCTDPGVCGTVPEIEEFEIRMYKTQQSGTVYVDDFQLRVDE
jgi:hypothetical protein